MVQAYSGPDSNSKSRNKNEEIVPVNRLNPTVCSDPPVPATTIRICTVKQRSFFAPTGADCRNRGQNLNAQRRISADTFVTTPVNKSNFKLLNFLKKRRTNQQNAQINFGLINLLLACNSQGF